MKKIFLTFGIALLGFTAAFAQDADAYEPTTTETETEAVEPDATETEATQPESSKTEATEKDTKATENKADAMKNEDEAGTKSEEPEATEE